MHAFLNGPKKNIAVLSRDYVDTGVTTKCLGVVEEVGRRRSQKQIPGPDPKARTGRTDNFY